MEKHRLELFSDGIFAIVLTLLVLDLRPPPHHGLAGLRDIGPALGIHALVFFLVGTEWITHHNMMTRVREISTGTLALNLLALFFVTLVPFAARIAAEDPLGSLGAGLISACGALYGLALITIAAFTPWYGMDGDAALRRDVKVVRWISRGLTASLFVATALCVISPWFGYAAIPLGGVYLTLPIVRRVHDEVGKSIDGAASRQDPLHGSAP